MSRGSIRKLVALASVLALMVLSAGVARADSINADTDVIEAGLQPGNPATVSLSPGGTHTFALGVQVRDQGNNEVTFPVTVDISKSGSILSMPSPVSGSMAAYGDAGMVTTQVTATAPQASELTCGIANQLEGKVHFTATNNTAILGNTGKSAEVVLKISVAGPACLTTDTTLPVFDPYTGPGNTEATSSSGATVTYGSPTATDNSGAAPTVTCLPASGSTFPLGTTTVNCTATDAAGNQATTSFSVTVVDTIAPVISCGAVDASWLNRNATISCTASDAASGLANSTDASFTLSTSLTSGEESSNASTSSKTVTDLAGNSATAGPISGNKVDLKAPTSISFGTSGIQSGGTYYWGYVPEAPTCDATDGGSGLAACAVTGRNSAVGSHTLTATATDNVGNADTATASYTVSAWTLKGFYRPVDGNGVYNSVKGGHTVPLKFNVYAGTELTDVSAVASFKTQAVVCDSTAPIDGVEVTSTGGTSLRYDSVGGQFVQNWKTPTLPGCHRVTMTTQDGTSITALFKITK